MEKRRSTAADEKQVRKMERELEVQGPKHRDLLKGGTESLEPRHAHSRRSTWKCEFQFTRRSVRWVKKKLMETRQIFKVKDMNRREDGSQTPLAGIFHARRHVRKKKRLEGREKGESVEVKEYSLWGNNPTKNIRKSPRDEVLFV